MCLISTLSDFLIGELLHSVSCSDLTSGFANYHMEAVLLITSTKTIQAYSIVLGNDKNNLNLRTKIQGILTVFKDKQHTEIPEPKRGIDLIAVLHGPTE